MSRWSEEQVLAAAPDAASVTAARKLARPGPWSETGANETLVWGKCQGSGKTPYQASIDLQEPAYRCSCPSRKFPCKHCLALLLLWAAGHVGEGADAAAFAQEWADQRSAKAESRAQRADKPVDPEEQAKRLAERLRKMDDGVDELILWLTDLARGGLATARSHPYSYWDRMAARLVDAQLPGLADRVRSLGPGASGRDDWAPYLLRQVGRLWLLAQAWRRREELSETEAADLRIAVGWPTPREQAIASGTRTGSWLVLGAHREDDGPLLQQRTWLRADTGELGLLLETAGPGQTLGVPQLAGAVLSGTTASYPGSSPARLLFVDPPEATSVSADVGPGTTIADAQASVSSALSTAPWRDRFPLTIRAARFSRTSIVDEDGDAFALLPNTHLSQILALTGGHPTDTFGELEAGHFRVLTLVVDGEVIAL